MARPGMAKWQQGPGAAENGDRQCNTAKKALLQETTLGPPRAARPSQPKARHSQDQPKAGVRAALNV